MKKLFRSLLGCLLLLHTATAASDNRLDQLPSLGDTAGRMITPMEDKKLGAAFMRRLRQSGIISNDAEATNYIETLGRRLAAKSGNPSRDFTFFLLNASTINAFAGPAGHIGVNIGLILAASSESELAGVLAHEIAHVTQRHLARAFDAADKMSIPNMAALAAALLIGSQNSTAGLAALTAASAANIQYQINFTRANEKEADRIGIQTLAAADFDPYGMSGFFERLQKNTRLYGNQPPEYLSTHPVTTDRISEALSRAESYPKTDIEQNLEFQLLQAKLRVNSYENTSQVLADVRRYKGNNGGNTAVEHYEFALLLAANNQLEDGQAVLEKLHRSDPDRIAYRLALANILHQGKSFKAALDLYASSLSLYPGSLMITLPYASALLSADQPGKAYALLVSSADKHPDNPEVHKLLAQAAGATGNAMQTHTATAQYYFLNGYTKRAIEQMKLAEKLPGLSNYQAALVYAGIKNLEGVLKDEKSE